MKRAFEFVDEKSHKFWWIESFQEKFVVNYGKIDSIGKYEIKEWDSIEETRRKEKEFEKELEELGYKADTTKLLGHPELIQGEYWEECEGVAGKNIYYGSTPIKYGNDNIKKAIKKNAKDWTLLMQMSELEIGDYGLYFGDCGKIYFNIRKEDLKNKNFDNIWLILQCY